MAGTKESGLAAADTNKRKYGSDFYKRIGAMGGSVKISKGFGKMTAEQRIQAGRRGGSISKRTKKA